MIELLPKTREMLADLPPYFHEDSPTRQVLNAFAAELELMRVEVEAIESGRFPQTAEDDSYGLLSYWERLLRLPVHPEYLSEDERRERALSTFAARHGSSGEDWLKAVSRAIGTTAWEYEENRPSDYKVTIWVPWPLESERFEDAEALIRVLTPAHLEVIVESTEAFIVDVSKVDEDKI